MEQLFTKAMDQDLIAPCVEGLKTLWAELGEPEEPAGPSTDVKGQLCSMADLSSLGDAATEEDVDSYNHSLETLFRLIGYVHIGSGIWYTQFKPGPEAWQEYKQRGEEIIDSFIEFTLFDRWCGGAS